MEMSLSEVERCKEGTGVSPGCWDIKLEGHVEKYSNINDILTTSKIHHRVITDQHSDKLEWYLSFFVTVIVHVELIILHGFACKLFYHTSKILQTLEIS